MADHHSLFKHCLYFNANALARTITRMAEEEFKPSGLSPSHALLLLLVSEKPGISQKQLCEQLHLSPSTVTRFLDNLSHRGYLTRSSEGRTSRIHPTEQGRKLQYTIRTAWKNLYLRYSKILGTEQGEALASHIHAAGQKLEQAR